MAWHQTNKPWPEPTMTQFTDAYIRVARLSKEPIFLESAFNYERLQQLYVVVIHMTLSNNVTAKN